MRRQRFQIALLVLGVVLGYGHAFTHWHWHGGGHCTKDHGRDFGHGEHYDRGRPSAQDHPRPAEPSKPEL
jgi:hypothetical protein